MKTILIPTDFSDNSLRAFRYAFELFGKDAKYIILNTYCEPRSTTASMVSLRDILHEGSEEGLIEFMGQVKALSLDAPNITTLSEYGDSIETICSTGRIKKADFIIMGTKGATGLKEVFLGSVAAGVVEHAECPVLAIPHDAPIREPKNMLFTTDLKKSISEDHKAIISNLSSLVDGNLTILSIDTDDDDISAEEAEVGYDLHVKFQNIEHAFEVVNSKDVETAITEFAGHNEMDLIITIPRKTNWLQRMVTTSISEKLAEHSHVPILCLK